ncbi:hypothetical protein C8236_07625 [Paracidovorax avenae]|uniref:hypothetical protein n=1 Tax=Paracidovorax avenae TaxID=80867 RepID=UPI000D227780|nr:hypothetical protein [Paracidovorax avenae]AVS98718.1 hypothetical protein C8236_07625 [Paracidovorax avenae]
MDDREIIYALGGPSAVAKLCERTPQAVVQWSGRNPNPKTGAERHIPKARLMFLRVMRPDVFAAAERTNEVIKNA